MFWNVCKFSSIQIAMYHFSVCHQMAKGVFLFFGVKDLQSVDIVESYTNKFHVPFISPTLHTVKDPGSSYQVHMTPRYTQAIIHMIKYYGRKVAYYVYDSHEGKDSMLHGKSRCIFETLVTLVVSDLDLWFCRCKTMKIIRCISV